MQNKYLSKKALFLTLLIMTSYAHANYRTPSENTELVEDAESGGAAIAIDASTNFFNSSGITRIKRPQFVAAGKGVRAYTRFVGASAGVSGTANSHIYAFAPAFHFTTPIINNFFFGFSLTTPFGSATKYPIGSIVQFVGTETSLYTIDLSPSLAYRFNQHFSLGAGPNAQYGRIIANSMFPPPPFPFNSEFKNDGSDWGYGWHVGGLYEFNNCTRIGLNYRSQVRHDLRGRSSLAGFPTNNNLSVKIPLPAITMLSIYHAFNPTWAVMGTLEYTEWSVVQNIVARNNAVSPITVFPQNFRNIMRYAIGGEYHANDKLILRTGLSYEPTPMNNTDRAVSLPINDSLIFGIGGHYQAYRCVGFDLGYLHIFTKRAPINNTLIGVTTVGNADSSIDALSMQITWDI